MFEQFYPGNLTMLYELDVGLKMSRAKAIEECEALAARSSYLQQTASHKVRRVSMNSRSLDMLKSYM
jgi:hypothetical protein